MEVGSLLMPPSTVKPMPRRHDERRVSLTGGDVMDMEKAWFPCGQQFAMRIREGDCLVFGFGAIMIARRVKLDKIGTVMEPASKTVWQNLSCAVVFHLPLGDHVYHPMPKAGHGRTGRLKPKHRSGTVLDSAVVLVR